MGAAFLAGVGAGVWKIGRRSPAAGGWSADSRPRLDPAARDAGYAGWSRAVERARGWAAP